MALGSGPQLSLAPQEAVLAFLGLLPECSFFDL